MANVVNLEAVSKSFGAHPLLSRVSLGIDDADRIGVVGVNGGGKTTLLEVLAGLEPPDGGRVSQARGLRLGVVTQRTELLPGATVRESVLDPLGFGAEHEWAADPRIRGVLDGMAIGNGQGRAGNHQSSATGNHQGSSTCWCSTSPPTTSTSRVCGGSPSTSSPGAAPWWW
jgi:ATP-binding cassette subfamily F protein uup